MNNCSIENCSKPVKARSWCERHYKYWQRRGEPKPYIREKRFCSVAGCENKNQAKGLCQRHYFVKWKYGISPESYEEMLKNQFGLCAICKRKCSSGKDLAVDHDHKTGLARGLLCQNCNWGVGNFQDDPNIMTSAIAYLFLAPK